MEIMDPSDSDLEFLGFKSDRTKRAETCKYFKSTSLNRGDCKIDIKAPIHCKYCDDYKKKKDYNLLRLMRKCLCKKEKKTEGITIIYERSVSK